MENKFEMQTHMEASTAFRLGPHTPGKPLNEQQIDTNMTECLGWRNWMQMEWN